MVHLAAGLFLTFALLQSPQPGLGRIRLSRGYVTFLVACFAGFLVLVLALAALPRIYALVPLAAALVLGLRIYRSLPVAFVVVSREPMSLDDMAEMFSAATGLERTADHLREAGERICNLERQFNLREGFTKEDDTLPTRLLEEPVAAGPSEGFTANLAPMLQEYYQFRGWDENGVPRLEKLAELGLDQL